MNGSSRGQENRFWDEEAAEIASTEAVDSGAFQSLLKSQAAGVHQTSARNSLVTTTSSGVPPVINEEAPLLDEPLLSSSHTEDPQWNHRTPSFHEGTFQQQNSVHNDNDDDQNPTLEPIRRMEYDSDSHLAVLFQMYGSVWPYVFPYCVFTVLLTVAVFLLQRQGFNNISFPTTNGHTFLSILVSFLVVTRANITYQRFMEAREYLNTCYRSCRELMHYTCVLTQQDTSEGAQEWRRQVAYKTILLLRVTMAAIDYRTSNVNTWDVMGSEKLEVLTPKSNMVDPSPNPSNKLRKRSTSSSADAGKKQQPIQESLDTASRRQSTSMPQTESRMEQISHWAHGVRTVQDENLRAPLVLAYNLRETILKQRNGQYLQNPMHVNEELKILGNVSEFISAFHGLQKLVTTPYPFPFIQMSRTFLFFWVFSLPLVLVDQMDHMIHVMIIIFFTTYGFLGLEYVSMELEDPFGNDPNDFDNQGMAQLVYEDIYIALFKQDGAASAEMLREKVLAQESKGNALASYHRNSISHR